ncbi:proteasome inhibitor PI31 subunit-like [Prorops nasuta]|uniref:proteasome inhibitor PI31 subunit-like n=1 Tax=Prorops nasuta TaxID=863751 RepID=UPI0034CD8029
MDTNNSSNTFGFQLLSRLYDSDVVKKEDVIILFIHWYLIKQNFKCIGLGDSKTFNNAESGSELLPENWNKSPNYALRYVHNGKLYILHGLRSDEDLLINLLRAEDHNLATVQFPIATTVNELHGPLESLMPSHQEVVYKIRNDLLEPVVTSNAVDASTQTSTSSERGSLRQDDSNPLRVPPRRPARQPPPFRDPFDVGRSDLDPFANVGGGMLFDPFSSGLNPLRPHPGNPDRSLGMPGRLPQGAVPPGARFDPFGPPDRDPPRPPRNPDSDHLPPPGYDDMFM